MCLSVVIRSSEAASTCSSLVKIELYLRKEKSTNNLNFKGYRVAHETEDSDCVSQRNFVACNRFHSSHDQGLLVNSRLGLLSSQPRKILGCHAHRSQFGYMFSWRARQAHNKAWIPSSHSDACLSNTLPRYCCLFPSALYMPIAPHCAAGHRIRGGLYRVCGSGNRSRSRLLGTKAALDAG